MTFEVVEPDWLELDLGVVLLACAQSHDADSGLEWKEFGLVVGAAFGKDPNTGPIL